MLMNSLTFVVQGGYTHLYRRPKRQRSSQRQSVEAEKMKSYRRHAEHDEENMLVFARNSYT